MARARRTEALVVGAGPVGLFTALALVRKGIEVTIVDEQWRTAAHSYALALHPASLELLDSLGLASEILPLGRKLDRIDLLVEGEEKGRISLADLSSPFPFLLVLPQSAFEGAMERSLASLGVEVRWNHSLSTLVTTPEGVRAEVDRLSKSSTGYAAAQTEWSIDRTMALEAEFAVGADGHASTVRAQLGIPFESSGPSELYAVFEFETREPVPDAMRLVLESGRTSVVWPLPGGRCRVSFEVEDAPHALQERDKARLSVQVGKWSFPSLGREELVKLLRERAPWLEGAVGELHWSLAVRFDRRLAARFGRDRAWLAGDAAHITGPVGIHSMNAGLAEGAALADCMEGILRRNASIDCLGECNRKWKREWDRLLSAAAKPVSTAEPWVGAHAENLVGCVPSLGDRLSTLLGQIGIDFRDEPGPTAS